MHVQEVKINSQGVEAESLQIIATRKHHQLFRLEHDFEEDMMTANRWQTCTVQEKDTSLYQSYQQRSLVVPADSKMPFKAGKPERAQ